MSQFLDIIQVDTQFFDKLKATVLVLQIEPLTEEKKPTYPFNQSPNLQIHFKRLVGIVNSLVLGKKSPSWWKLHSFSAPFDM